MQKIHSFPATGDAGCGLITPFATVIVYVYITAFQKSNFLHTNKSMWRNMACAKEIYSSRVVPITEVNGTFYVYYHTVLKMYFFKGKLCHYRH